MVKRLIFLILLFLPIVSAVDYYADVVISVDNAGFVNIVQLRKPLVEKTEYHFILNNDTEIIMHYLARALKGHKKPELADMLHNVTKKFDGAFLFS